MATIDSTEFQESGLYLIWPDGNRLALTRSFISATTEAMLLSPDCIPPTVRAATGYQPCGICPERDHAVICHAIMPTLPFTEGVDRYMSYDQVTAVYREQESNVFCVVDTTMQEALKYISILSLTQYCEVGRKYGGYFKGVNPLMPPPDIAAAVYKNLFLAAGGNLPDVSDILLQMRDELLHVVRCQMNRLRLICAQDAFLNAFVSTYNVTELIFSELQDCLLQASSGHPPRARAAVPAAAGQ